MDPAIESFLVFADVFRGDRLARDLFVRSFGGEPPSFGTHMIAFNRNPGGTLSLLGYVHLWTRDGIGYIGGVCTDAQALRRMPASDRLALQSSGGGVYYHLLRHTFDRFAGALDAYAGYCGDARALQVNLQAGFVATRHPHLLIRPNRPMDAARLEALVEQAHAVGPF